MKLKGFFNTRNSMNKIDYSNQQTVNGVKFIKLLPYDKKRIGLFICPSCNNEWVSQTYKVEKSKSRCCRKCYLSTSAQIMLSHKNTINRKIKLTVNNPELAKKQFFLKAKRDSKKRGYNFSLDYKFFKEIILKNCHYCGIEPLKLHKSDSGTHTFLRNGIDRMVNSIGYDEDNCVPCCSTCNYAKRDMDYSDFIFWINKIKE